MSDTRQITMSYEQYRNEIDDYAKSLKQKAMDISMLRDMLRSLCAWDIGSGKLLNDEYKDFKDVPSCLRHINDCINDSIGW